MSSDKPCIFYSANEVKTWNSPYKVHVLRYYKIICACAKNTSAQVHVYF